MKTIKNPVTRFIQLETSSSILLFGVTILAIFLANSPWSEDYLSIWKNEISIALPGFDLSKPLYKWINDGLMAIFFFLIGLEIKREILSGELSHLKKASLPLFAAIGGMLVPALIFTYLNAGKPGAEGWGIPIAADIAFSLGILTLLGKRVPSGLKIFLMAFAIIDDLGAVLIIALFYSSELIWMNIFIGLAIIAALLVLTRFNFFSKYLFFAAGIIVWILFLKSGIHATIAGVLMALTIPLTRKTNTRLFYDESKPLLDEFMEECKVQGAGDILSKKQLIVLDELEDLTKKTISPLQHYEHSLHGWVSYLIMPLFAFANAGVVFSFGPDTNLSLALNLALSMVVGNFVGILGFSWIAVKLKLADLPQQVKSKQLAGVALLGGLGFTMALFINSLAYSDPVLVNSAKIGIIAGSTLSGLLGFLVLRFSK